MRHTIHLMWTTVLIISLGLFCTINDDNGDPGITSPPSIPNTRLSVFASTEQPFVLIGDTIIIRVNLVDENQNPVQPIPAEVITAYCSRGKLVNTTATSDENGRALFHFTDTIAGKIDLRFKSNGVETTIQVEVTDTPDKIQKLIEAIPEKSIIKADGEDLTDISVRVLNRNHNPLAGEYIQFITTAGIIIGDGSNPNNSGQSITGPDGIAKATLVSSNINDTAYITAYLVSDQALSDEIEVIFKGMKLSVSVNKTNLIVGDTAVITTNLINASGYDVAKAAVFYNFTEPGDSVLQIISADSSTNYEGRALAYIKALKNGSNTLKISSSGTESILQLNVSNLSLSISLNKTVLQTGTKDTSRIDAVFADNSGTPLKNRIIKLTANYLTANDDATSQTQSQKTDASGKCTFTILPLAHESTLRLELIAFDNTNGYASADTTIQFITTREMVIQGPEAIPADGVSKSPVIVYIKNKNGNPVVGDLISFSTTAGIITSEAQTDSDGKAEAYLRSDRRNIVATVTAVLKSDPTKIQYIPVEFTGVTMTATADPQSISHNGEDTSTIVVVLEDAAHKTISGEPVNFSKKLDATKIISADTYTNSRGEARCRIYGTGSGLDTIMISAAGTQAYTLINYSSNILLIDTVPGQSCVADSTDSTRFSVTCLEGDKKTPVPGATLEICVTAGKMDTIFAKIINADNNGKAFFTARNPHFATTSTISVLARKSSEVTNGSFQLYFRANKVAYIELNGTPEVISTNGDRARITAVAYDKFGNRVKDERISFNILNGPGGGEHLDPPVVISSDDGSATTYLVAGKIPSFHRQVWIAAGDFNSSILSDTVKFTIAGPPKYITVATNVLKGENPNDGTFALPCAAIVTDINGNPVVDGTKVTFSLKISGVVNEIFKINIDENSLNNIDTVFEVLPFEDFNDNFKLDPGEDRNGDGYANRGEDVNGDGIFEPGPAFEDINGDGIRQYCFYDPVEKTIIVNGRSKLIDLNKNGYFDPIEPLRDPVYLAAYTRLLTDSAFYYYPEIRNAKDSSDFATLDSLDAIYANLNIVDIDVNGNGLLDPNTAVSITRTIETKDGVSTNKLIYGQSDAMKIEVMIWAEAQGVVTETPEQLILPIVSGD